jgi:LPS sulfotransferase NodH
VHGKVKSTSFVIFATQRTGSNWLMGMLDAHPAVACYDELLLAGDGSDWGRTDLEFFEPYYRRHRGRNNPFARAFWSFRYLNTLYRPREGAEAIGMKLMYEQLWKNPCVWLYMVRHRVRVVHLVRRNLLDVVVSKETADARQRYHAWQGDAVETPAVTLDPKMAIATLKTLDFRVKVARWLVTVLPVRHYELSYEQLVADPTIAYDVFNFLEINTRSDPPALVSKFKKLNTLKKPDLIANYAEVVHVLKGTRFEPFVD